MQHQLHARKLGNDRGGVYENVVRIAALCRLCVSEPCLKCDEPWWEGAAKTQARKEKKKTSARCGVRTRKLQTQLSNLKAEHMGHGPEILEIA